MLGRTLAALLKFEAGGNLTVTSHCVTRLENLPKACRHIDITTPLQSHQSLQLCFDLILLRFSNLKHLGTDSCQVYDHWPLKPSYQFMQNHWKYHLFLYCRRNCSQTISTLTIFKHSPPPKVERILD